MKKILIIIFCLIISISLLTGCKDEKVDDNTETVEVKPLDLPIEEIALLYTNDLLAGNYEDAFIKYAHDENMIKAVNANKYKLIFKDLIKKSGDFVEVKETFTTKSGAYDIVSIPVILEKQNTNINVVFNSEKYISGINFPEYQEASNVIMPDTIIEQDLTSDVNGFKLPGTLTFPKEGESFPCVILVHGSGPNDRDETLYQNKPFRDIAWGLAEKGIAVYRYDKRSYVYGNELMDDFDVTLYEETIDDSVEIAKMMQYIEKINKDKIYILGHSLGGFAIPRIAQNSEETAGFIIMAGAVRNLKEMILEQYEYIFNIDETISKEEKTELEKVNNEMTKLDNLDNIKEDEIIMGAYKAYWIDNMNYRPIETAKSIDRPVLVLQGERDYQVTMEDYNMWKDNFSSDNNWTFITYPKLNHMMMPGEGKPTNTEYKIVNRVSEKLIDDIAEWID